MSESLFNKFADLRPATLLKKDSGTGVFLRILRNFLKHLFFTEYLWWLLLKACMLNHFSEAYQNQVNLVLCNFGSD